MSFDFKTLITDRSQTDVSALYELLKKPVSTWTDDELDAFNGGLLKGGYWWTDLNRVTACMEYLDSELKNLGYLSGYSSIVIHPDPPPSMDENTVLLLHGEDLTDSSLYGVAITNSGVQVSESKSKFGGKSLYFNGGSKLTFSSKVVDFGSGDFTYDWWEYLTLSTSAIGTRFCTQNGVPNTGMSVGNNGDKLYFNKDYRTPVWDLVNAAVVFGMTPNVWVHYAIVRNGETILVFKNGSKVYSASIGDVSCVIDTSLNAAIGSNPGNNNMFNGYIDEFRISNVARWVSNFTPSEEPYKVEDDKTPAAPGLDPKTWYKEDVQVLSKINRYLSNIQRVRNTLAVADGTPEAPKYPKGITITEANNIEKILMAVESSIQNIKRSIDLGWALGISHTGLYGGI